MMRFKKLLLVVALVATGLGVLAFNAPKAQALSGSEFNPGRIIDDSVFFNKDAMSVNDIQNFIYSKSGNCDTYHATGNSNYQPPWTCLYQYRENPDTKANNIGNPGANPSGSISAAQIIYNAAQQYSVSPKVLLVLLQKEQSLLTDNWPYPSQYRGATGMGCPDTAACDSQYYGFYNQVYGAARQYRLYANNPNNYNYKAGRNNNIGYNPNAGCGYQTVYIQNQATAGLYNYTPYVPNAAALNNLYGTGDGCSAYGNRNFWRLWNDWFGSPIAAPYAWQYVNQTSSPSANMIATQRGTWTVSAKNVGTATWSNSGANVIRLGTSRANDRTSGFCNCNRLATLNESSVAPGQVGTFTFSVQAPASAGSYQEYFNLVAEGITWMNDPGLYFSGTINSANMNATVISNTMPSSMTANSTVSSIITIRNDSNVTWYKDGKNPINLGTTSPSDRTSSFATESWLSSNRPARMNESSVAPGQNATFSFDLRAPSSGSKYDESFRLLSEGYQWFGPIITKSISLGAQPSNIVQSGQNLNAGQTVTSSDGRYRLVMQNDGNLVLYSPNRAIWWTGTNGRPANRLAVQADGNLVVYGPNTYYWASWTIGKTNVRLVVQDDGNLVLYDAQNRAVWNTGTQGKL